MGPAPRGARRGAARRRTSSAPSAGDREPREGKQKPPTDPGALARQVCLSMLERKARSRSELEQALTKREIPDEVSRAVLDRFTEVGLIDDVALAEAVAGAQHRERGLARRAVAMKLRGRGFDDEVVESAVSGIDSEHERARALDLVTRRLRALSSLPVEVQTRRLIGLLARKGYPSAMVYDVVREAMRDAKSAADGSAGLDDFLDVST